MKTIEINVKAFQAEESETNMRDNCQKLLGAWLDKQKDLHEVESENKCEIIKNTLAFKIVDNG